MGYIVQTPVKIMCDIGTSKTNAVSIHLHPFTSIYIKVHLWDPLLREPSQALLNWYITIQMVMFDCSSVQKRKPDTVDSGVATIPTGSVPFNTVFRAKKPMLLLHSAAFRTAYALSCRSADRINRCCCTMFLILILQ